MSKTLRFYLLRQFLTLLLVAAGTLAFLFLVFDLLAQSDKILSGGMPPWQSIPLYAGLRLPQIASLILPIAAMLAIMATYSKLHGTHEIAAITSAGIRLTRVISVFLFGALIAACLHFIFINSVVLHTSEQLRTWQENDYKPQKEQELLSRYPAWFEIKDRMIFVENAQDQNRILVNVRLIERDKTGLMAHYTAAPKVTYTEGTKWLFHTPEIRQLETGEMLKKQQEIIDLHTIPQDLAIFNKQIDEMTLSHMWTLMKAAHLTNNRGYYYNTWFQRRFSKPLSILVMTLVAAPLLFMRPRHANKTGLSFLVLLAGFLFFIGERITLAMGESGELAPTLTIWALPLLFASFLFGYIFWKESRFS